MYVRELSALGHHHWPVGSMKKSEVLVHFLRPAYPLIAETTALSQVFCDGCFLAKEVQLACAYDSQQSRAPFLRHDVAQICHSKLCLATHCHLRAGVDQSGWEQWHLCSGSNSTSLFRVSSKNLATALNVSDKSSPRSERN